MRAFTVVHLVVLLFAATCAAADSFKYEAVKDEITNEETRTVSVSTGGSDRDTRATLLLQTTAQGNCTLKVVIGATIFPDKAGEDLWTIANVSVRSTAMDSPFRKEWLLPPGKYSEASTSIDADTARKIFGGDSIALQFDKMQSRYRFATGGEDAKPIREAVEKTLELAK